MKATRRDMMRWGGAVAAFVVLAPFTSRASEADDAIKEITGGAEIANDGVELIAPEIAENGNTVPLEVVAEGASAITIVATANPEAVICKMNFGPKSGASRLSTRIRLAATQDVIALAQMRDGTFAQSSKEIKVTIGGCGG